MQIKSISVENFKSFSKLDKLKLTQINMVYGFNNSGKSNLLKLIDIIFRSKKSPESITKAIVDYKVESHISTSDSKFWEGIIENEPFIFHLYDNKKPIIFSIIIDFDQSEIERIGEISKSLFEHFPTTNNQTHEIEINGDFISLNAYDSKMRLSLVKFNNIEIFSESTYFPSVEPTDPLYDNEEVFASILNIMNNTVKFLDNDRYFIKEKEDPNEKIVSAKNFKNWLFQFSMDVFRKDDYNELIDLLSTFKTKGDKNFNNNEKSSPFNSLNVEFARVESEIEIFLRNDFNRFPISSYGTGIQQIFYILLIIFYSKAKIILIEEIELNLSPKYQMELLSFISELMNKKKKLSQLIFTTHSPLFCYKGDFNILNVNINHKGESEISDVSRSEIEQFMDIKKMMMQGDK